MITRDLKIGLEHEIFFVQVKVIVRKIVHSLLFHREIS